VPFNVDATYASGGGTPAWKVCQNTDCFPLTIVSSRHLVYCTLALGDGVADHGSYVRRRTSTSTLSFTNNSRATDIATEERERQQDEAMQNLMQSHQHILGILHIRVSYMFNLSNLI
jgi:hypothetical protein